MRIENPFLALYRGTEYFSLARTFRTVWGGEMQKGLAKTLANPLQERKRQDSNLRTALGRSTVFEAASFSHSDTLPVIILGLCPKLSQFPHPPFQGGRSGPAGFPSPLGLPCLPAPARHLMMPCYLFYWDPVPNPDTPCGLCVLHVFAAANTRTRPVV